MEATRPVSADLSHYLGHVPAPLVGRRLLADRRRPRAPAPRSPAPCPKVYESRRRVLVQAVDQDTNAHGGRTKGTINLDTEAQLVGSGAVAVKAAAAAALADLADRAGPRRVGRGAARTPRCW